jgi:hypothetical protein
MAVEALLWQVLGRGDYINKCGYTDSKEDINTLIYPGCGICLSPNQPNKALIYTSAYGCDNVSQCAICVILVSGYKLRITEYHPPKSDDH